MTVETRADACEASDFHLVESSSGWRLTIRLSDELLAAMAAQSALSRAGPFRVEVSPNLVPGVPFDAYVDVMSPDRPDPRPVPGENPAVPA